MASRGDRALDVNIKGTAGADVKWVAPAYQTHVPDRRRAYCAACCRLNASGSSSFDSYRRLTNADRQALWRHRIERIQITGKTMQATLEDFVDDAPWADDIQPLQDVTIDNMIQGVRLQRLVTRTDDRGDLTVLFSDLHHQVDPSPHVYLVTAEPGSIRAWVYHRQQSDRLAFCSGLFRVVLYDLRPDSPTKGTVNVMDLGAENKILLTIPPFVVHGVENIGSTASQFVNMPTKAYDPRNPDKSRVRWNHPGIPYQFG